MTMLAVIGVSKNFGEGVERVSALNDVDLTIESGQLTVLMGPSGSGKTTLLSILGCILKPTNGRVWIANRYVETYSEAALADICLNHIGFVFQGYNLFPNLTVLENVQIANTFGRKQIFSEDPAILVDRKVLEVLIDLKEDSPLLPGMRVDVFIEKDKEGSSFQITNS